MFHVKRGLWASILRIFGVGAKKKANPSGSTPSATENELPTHPPLTQADDRPPREGSGVQAAKSPEDPRPTEPPKTDDEAGLQEQRPSDAASTAHVAATSSEEQFHRPAPTRTGGDTESSKTTSPSADTPVVDASAEPTEEQQSTPESSSVDHDADAAGAEPATEERAASNTETAAARTTAEPGDAARSTTVDARVTRDDAPPGGRPDQPTEGDELTTAQDRPSTETQPSEGEEPAAATIPSATDGDNAEPPPTLGEPASATGEVATREEASNGAPDADEAAPNHIDEDAPGAKDRRDDEADGEDAVSEEVDGEDRADAAVSGWAAHEWRLEWKAAMDEREEEVFHVKPPEDADAAASFSIDDEDTPLARELADLTARRRVLNDVSLDLSGHKTRVLTISNQKGGVGKTTTSVNIAAALADLGARVLVIDLDPQGNASTALNVPHTAETPSVYDVLIDEFPLADIIQVSPESPNLLCAPSTIHLAGAEIELVSQVAREHRLRTALDDYLASSTERLDFVLIDCPPSLGLLTINAFTAAQEVLLPIQCEYYALEGLSQLLATVRMIQKHLNPELRLTTILLTMYDGRTRLSQQVAEEVRAHFPNEVLNSVIPRSVRVSEAPSFGQTVIAYDGQSAGAVAYREAAVEIVARGESGPLGGATADVVGREAGVGGESVDDAQAVVEASEHVLSEGGA